MFYATLKCALSSRFSLNNSVRELGQVFLSLVKDAETGAC